MKTSGSGASPQGPQVLHLSTYDSGGGAARAAFAIHQALGHSGMSSWMRVGASGRNDPSITANNKYAFMAAKEADRRLWSLQRSHTATWRSPARFGSLTAKDINSSRADIIHLHWVTDGFLSVETIGAINKPIVWSLCDAWAFSGSEHYATDVSSLRAREGYTRDNRPLTDSGFDIDRWTWARKEKLWSTPMHLVPASTWLTQEVQESRLMSSWPTSRIPHIVNTDVFAPRDQHHMRTALGIPTDRPVVLFLASAGIHDHRKGWDLLAQALSHLAPTNAVTVVVVGPAPSAEEQQAIAVRSPHHFIFFGEAHGDDQLVSLYSAADLTAVPSREDNMPITAMESQSCGTPVVAFAIGGLPDIVVHESTGYLAHSEDPQDLAVGIDWATRSSVHQAARDHALATWSPSAVVPQLTTIYTEVLA